MGTEHLPRRQARRSPLRDRPPRKGRLAVPAAGEKIWKKFLHSPDIESKLMFKISKTVLFSHIRNTIFVYGNP